MGARGPPPRIDFSFLKKDFVRYHVHDGEDVRLNVLVAVEFRHLLVGHHQGLDVSFKADGSFSSVAVPLVAVVDERGSDGIICATRVIDNNKWPRPCIIIAAVVVVER